MAETEQQTPKKAYEGKSPAWAFKRTKKAQLKREGSVIAEYNNRDDSSRVGTTTTFGDALIWQEWILINKVKSRKSLLQNM